MFDDTDKVDVVLDTVGQMADIMFILPYVLRHMWVSDGMSALDVMS